MTKTSIALTIGALAIWAAGTAAEVETVWRGLIVLPEQRCSPYVSDEYDYSQNLEMAVVSELGGVYAPYSDHWLTSRRQTDIEHIVARSEAHDSGLCARSAAERRAFANDLANLTLALPAVNRQSKGARDAAEWQPDHNACWFAARVVEVRRRWRLTIDAAEARALEATLAGCTSTELRREHASAAAQPRGHRPAASRGRLTCREAWALGIAPVHRGDPHYPRVVDGDGDGIACERPPRR